MEDNYELMGSKEARLPRHVLSGGCYKVYLSILNFFSLQIVSNHLNPWGGHVESSVW